ncbi:MAG: PLD nuclease N-terminal domain-containing protein [Verrucomicrobiaceae bacterium]|nr:PLD nuclease N-terminal domain-containing protein [Verrucomicrobiaceae bacterium]
MNWDGITQFLGWSFLTLVGIAVFGFWVKVLMDATSERDSSNRLAWVLVVFFGGIFGALFYSVFRMPSRRAEDLESGHQEPEQLLREMRYVYRERH